MDTNVTLSKRQMQIANLLFLGKSYKEIPEYLPSRSGGMLSVNTVKNTIDNIFRKIGITKMTELSLWWVITQLNISVDFSPLKRKICAMMMTVLLTFQFAISDGDFMVRSLRSSRSVSRTLSSRGGARKTREDFDFNTIEL